MVHLTNILRKCVNQKLLNYRSLSKCISQQRPISQMCIGSFDILYNHKMTNNFQQFITKRFNATHSTANEKFLVQDVAPDFSEKAVMEDGSVKVISLSSYRGKNVVLFFYPLDFTFVCPSEITTFNNHLKLFQERNTEVIGVSVDSVYSHIAWRSKPLNQGGIDKIGFPLVSDLSKSISKKYNVLIKDGTVSLRGLFLIDKTGIIRHITINDMPLGRNVDEVLRLIDALHHYETHGEVCPANWKKGSIAMKPTAQGVAEYLSIK